MCFPLYPLVPLLQAFLTKNLRVMKLCLKWHNLSLIRDSLWDSFGFLPLPLERSPGSHSLKPSRRTVLLTQAYRNLPDNVADYVFEAMQNF